MSRHSLLCRDTDQANGSEILSQHLTTLSQHKEMKISYELYGDKKYQNNDKSRQCACNKVFHVATDISVSDKTKADFMLRQKKTMLQHNIQRQQ